MEPMLASLINRKFTIHRWAQELSRQLLLFTHRQWSYRNSTAHYKPSEGKTVAEHELVDDQVKSLLLLPLSSLPPQHRHLLAQDQTKSLLRGTTTAKQFWIANVHSALADKIQERYSTYKVSQQDQTGTYCSLGLTASSYCKQERYDMEETTTEIAQISMSRLTGSRLKEVEVLYLRIISIVYSTVAPCFATEKKN